MIERIKEVPSKEDLNKVFTESMLRLSQEGDMEGMEQVFEEYREECDRRYFRNIKSELENRGIKYTENENDILFEVGEHEYQISNASEDTMITAVAIHKDTSYQKRQEVTDKEDGFFTNEDWDHRILGFNIDYQKKEEPIEETSQGFIDKLLQAYEY